MIATACSQIHNPLVIANQEIVNAINLQIGNEFGPMLQYIPQCEDCCCSRRFAMTLASSLAQDSISRSLDEIQKSEAKLRQVVDTIPALVWSNLADGPNDFSNQLCRTTQVSVQRTHEAGLGSCCSS
jgi:hypothetical protein